MLLLCVLALCAQVDLPLGPPVELTSVGEIVTVELRAEADASNEIAAIDAILSWDPSQLTLIDATDEYPWFVSGFLTDPDGINADITDGQALYTVLSLPSAPVVVPPDILVASFRFQVIHTGTVSLLPSLGTFGHTRVVSATPGVEVTGSIAESACFGIPGFWTDLGLGLAGTGGKTPHLAGSGPLTCEELAIFTLTDARPGALCYYILGITNQSVPFKGGVIVPSLEVLIALIVPPDGTIEFGFSWPPGLPPGISLYYQYWIRDPEGVFGFAASNGLQSTTG